MSKIATWRETDARQIELTNCVVDFITSSLQPLSRVDDPAFRSMIHKAQPAFTMPSRKYLRTKLPPEKTAQLHRRISDRLKNLHSICLTVDIWSSRGMRAYIGIIAHYILDYKPESVMLACKRFKGSHTAENILVTYQHIVANFGIEHKIGTVITDNAAHMLKAFVQLPGTPLTSTTEDSDSDDDQDDEIECTTDPADMDYLPPHIPCFLHSLQLVVKDGLNNMGTGSTAIAKGAKLVSHVRHSCLASDLLEDGYKLQAKNDTRWNSTLVMLKSLLKADPLKLEKLNTQYKLSTFDIKICKEIINIFTPFDIATTQCQSQNSVTASLVIPCIRGLRAELDEFSTTSKSKLISTLITSINKRLQRYESNDAFKLATVLDPGGSWIGV